MKEYDIFVPLYYNDGRPVEAEKFQTLQAVLLDRFEGLTFFPQPNKGIWKMADVTYRDEIVIYRVITSTEGARDFLKDFKTQLKSEFNQEEILIIARCHGDPFCPLSAQCNHVIQPAYSPVVPVNASDYRPAIRYGDGR